MVTDSVILIVGVVGFVAGFYVRHKLDYVHDWFKARKKLS